MALAADFCQTLGARIIALEGIDQSGKRTQARLLKNHLSHLGARTGRLSFPVYETPAGKQIRRFLNHEIDYPPEALHMLYSLNRWENLAKLHGLVSRTDYIVADRYIASNLAYGIARGLRLRWLESLDEGLPAPDIVIVLDVPVPFSFRRKPADRDAHETNRSLLVNARKTYKILSRKLNWKIVDGTKEVAEVESAIWTLVSQRFRLPQ